VVISHRPAALELADRVMTLGTANPGARAREGSRLGRSER
jgi:ABC-type protease/lipase transport system fused ATPase/permease subunit